MRKVKKYCEMIPVYLNCSDYYYNIKNHKESDEGPNAFNIRIIYFTFKNYLSKDIKTRFRLESAHGKFGEKSKINPIDIAPG